MGKEIDGDLRKIFKSYLGNWDLPVDGSDMVVTISRIEEDEIRSKSGVVEAQPIIYFEEFTKPLICNQENNNRLTRLLGPRQGTKGWYGEIVALRREPNAQSIDGYCVRVNPNYKPKVIKAICENCGCVVEPTVYNGKNYSVNKIITITKSKYGQTLCWDCAMARKEAAE